MKRRILTGLLASSLTLWWFHVTLPSSAEMTHVIELHNQGH